MMVSETLWLWSQPNLGSDWLNAEPPGWPHKSTWFGRVGKPRTLAVPIPELEDFNTNAEYVRQATNGLLRHLRGLSAQTFCLVAPEYAAWASQGDPLGFGSAHASPDALPDDFPLHLREGREQVQQELGHWTLRACVYALRGAEEADAEGGEFLDRADAVSYAPAPAVQFPHQNPVELSQSRIAKEAIEFGRFAAAPLNPVSTYSAKTCQSRLRTY
jgi:hypothetical protein